MHVARLLMKDSFKHSSFASLPRLSDLQHYFDEQILVKDTLRHLLRKKEKVDRLTHYYQPILPNGDTGTQAEYDLPAREVSTSRLLGKLGPNEVESGPQGRSGSYLVLCLAASRAEISAWMAFAVWSRRRCNLRALRVGTDKVWEVKCTKHHLENSHTAIAQMPMQIMDTASIRSASKDTGRDTSSSSSSCWLAAPKTCTKARSTARVLNCKSCWAKAPAPAVRCVQ